MPKEVFLPIFTGTTTAYTVLMIVLRPFERASDNLVEILNELFYVGF